ncbi:MAG: hypothetical protein ACHRHE_07450 [Tepidisphaerales bacterium]
MNYIGRIEVSAGINKSKWIALIASHRALAPVPPAIGINPFTRKECTFTAPATSAIVSADGVHIGSISWAQDNSPMLIVTAADESVEAVAVIADDVASSLGAIFVRETLEE